MEQLTIAQIKKLDEKQDKVELKEAKKQFPFTGGKKTQQKERRKCYLGYVVALANERGGHLILGVKEGKPNEIVGTDFWFNRGLSLEDEIYNALKIRVHTYELYDDGKRVLVCQIPSRPVGKTLKYEGVALMRSGDSLRNMSDDEMFAILSENEPDFSATIADGLTIADLDSTAIETMKRAYARKQKNPGFILQSDVQALKDLDLLTDSKVTFAALILLGKDSILKARLPQAQMRLEYRRNKDQITFDQRYIFQGAFYNWIDKLWDTINLRNGSIPVQEGSYIFEVPYFNEEVIREAINNMIAHRSYNMQSESIIKQSETAMTLINPGGLPKGVSKENILTVSSTPRNRLLTEVLQKTGIVERSGQGVDKIFYQTLKEGKSKPDYSRTDDFQVQLDLSATIEDKAFALFIQSYQRESTDDEKLSVFDVLYLKKIKKGIRTGLDDKGIINNLLNKGLIEKKGKTRGVHYVLSRDYYEFTDQKGVLSRSNWDDNQAVPLIVNYLQQYKRAKTKDFIDLFQGRLTRRQVRTILEKQLASGLIERKGKTKGSFYQLSPNYRETMELLPQILKMGIERMQEIRNIEDDPEEE